MGLNKFGKGD
ncbi:hypothetical protein RDI58_028714 [Solanum bulbocastanum]|uniref:Uncharacterized protein n=1 Tax=Solanum bulbocastanum TaxID=147425 RepID=A0AAN8SUZ3_SOLBU